MGREIDSTEYKKMHNKIVKIAIFLLRSKALNVIIVTLSPAKHLRMQICLYGNGRCFGTGIQNEILFFHA